MMKAIILLLVCLCIISTAFSNNVHVERSWTESKALDIIKENLKYSADDTINCSVEKCCDTSSNECSLKEMAADKSTFVFPGGSTQCIFGSPYAFQVIPGKSDKLLVYFQGGGACWDPISTLIDPLCTTDIRKQSPVGIFDRLSARNEFKDFTIVMGIYCSGDIWAGNKTQDYSKNGQPVTQVGYLNAKATVDWVTKQQASGSLSSVLSNLVIMGCSAGSIGAQLWANTVLEKLQYKTAAVVPDSYAGIFPDGSEGPLIYSFGACSTPLIASDLKSSCNAQSLTMRSIAEENIKKVPNIPYAYIQSKVDEVQMSFYVSVGITTNTSAVLTPSSFYAKTNELFGTYNALDKNFITFLVNGPHHCYTNQEIYYTADGLGYENNGKGGAGMLSDWLNQLPLVSGSSISTQCTGEVAKNVVLQKSSEIIDLTTNECTYCSASLVPKTFSE